MRDFINNPNYLNPTFNNFKPREKISNHVLKGTPEVIISSDIKNKINFLHDKVKNVEWSGVLIYEILEGNIHTPNTFKVKIKDIVLMDIGSSAYTEYSLSGAMEKDNYVFDKVSEAMMEDNLRIGHIHTHHGMQCFFSGTDMQELEDNSGAYTYYLSLIVNFKNIDEWCAKFSFYGKITKKEESSIVFKNDNGDDIVTSEEENKNEKALFMYDCKITGTEESLIENEFIERYNELKKVNAIPARGGYFNNNDYNPKRPIVGGFNRKIEGYSKVTTANKNQTRLDFNDIPSFNTTPISTLNKIDSIADNVLKEIFSLNYVKGNTSYTQCFNSLVSSLAKKSPNNKSKFYFEENLEEYENELEAKLVSILDRIDRDVSLSLNVSIVEFEVPIIEKCIEKIENLTVNTKINSNKEVVGESIIQILEHSIY